jgi:nitrite reductase/ring-hydroxylating ferredoxin subunit
LSDQNEIGFKQVCKVSELPNGTGKRFIVDDKEVAVFKMDDELFALYNVCPHQHFNFIYDGIIEKGCVICPIHGWRFELETGKNPDGGKGLESYPVKVVNDIICVKVPEIKRPW